MDLVGRKLGQQGGKPMLDFLGDVGRFVGEHATRPGLAASWRSRRGRLGAAARRRRLMEFMAASSTRSR